MFSEPEALSKVLKYSPDGQINEKVINRYLDEIIRPARSSDVGDLTQIDFEKAGAELKKMFNKPATRRLLREQLGDEKFIDFEALSNVYSKLGNVMQNIRQTPGAMDIIRQQPSALGKAGKALEMLYDYAGYLKNSTIGKVPGLKWTSSRIKVSNKLVDQVSELVNKKIANPSYDFTSAEQRILKRFGDMVEGLSKISGGAMSQIAEHTKETLEEQFNGN
jgi:hypothetical protein